MLWEETIKMKQVKNKVSVVLVMVMSLFVLAACNNGSGEATTSKNDQYDTAMREGQLAISNKDYTEAEKSFEKALSYKEKDTKATTFLDQTKNYVKAESDFKAEKLDQAKTEATNVVNEKKGSKDLIKAGESLLAKIEATTNKEVYQALYDTSKKQFDAGKLDDAAGTVDELLAKDLTAANFKSLKQEAEALKVKINQAQAALVKEQQQQQVTTSSKYKTERNSELAAAEFKKATGKDIKQATDDEIAAWLAQKSDSEKATTGTIDSSSSSDSSAASSDSSAATNPDSEKIKIITAVSGLTGYSYTDNQYYVTKENADLFQVEIRHAHTVDGTEISNMVGMFQYTPSTGGLEKMDPITGEYGPFKKDNTGV